MAAQPALFEVDAHGMYRVSDIETSRGAAVIAITNAATNRQAALVALYNAGDPGLTDFELADVTGVGQTSIGVRRGELRNAGLVAWKHDDRGIGVRRPSPSGALAAVWILTARGVAEAERIIG